MYSQFFAYVFLFVAVAISDWLVWSFWRVHALRHFWRAVFRIQDLIQVRWIELLRNHRELVIGVLQPFILHTLLLMYFCLLTILLRQTHTAVLHFTDDRHAYIILLLLLLLLELLVLVVVHTALGANNGSLSLSQRFFLLAALLILCMSLPVSSIDRPDAIVIVHAIEYSLLLSLVSITAAPLSVLNFCFLIVFFFANLVIIWLDLLAILA